MEKLKKNNVKKETEEKEIKEKVETVKEVKKTKRQIVAELNKAKKI